jgi:CHAT domain-containing protein/tetratricopeptide (TPR) repeat protein
LLISRKFFQGILSAFIFFLPLHLVNAQNIHSNKDSLILIQAQRFFESGRYDSAVRFYEKYLSMVSLPCNSSAGIMTQKTKADKDRYLNVLLCLGTSYNMIPEPGNALSVLNAGLMIAERDVINDSLIKALLFYQTGNAYLLKMDYKNSIHSYQNALVIAHKDDGLLIKINQNLGGIFFFREDYDNAIEHYQKALVIQSLKMSSDPLKISELLINTGSAFVEKNEYIKAEDYFSKAEKLFQGINTTEPEKYARLCVSLGYLFMKMNNIKAAYDHFMKASQLYHLDKQVKPDEVILLYSNIAQLCRKQFVFDSAIHYYHLAISFIPDKSERFILILANLYRNMGETYGMQKKWNQALMYYQKALEALIPAASESLSPSTLKTIDPAKTHELFRIRDDRARTLFRMGMDEDSVDFILKSFNEYLSAIKSVDLINKEFGREGSRLFFNESVKDVYYGALETGYYLLTHDHKELGEQLFLINEKSRSKILLSGYMDQIAKKASGVTDSLLCKEKMLNDEISFCTKKLVIDQPVFVKEYQYNYLFYLNKLIGLHQEIDTLQIKYEHASPLYRKIKEQESEKSYKEIQQQLSPEEALLSYFTGDTSLFVFVVKSDSLVIRRISVSPEFNNEISKFSKVIRLAEQQDFYETAYDLYCKLIMPVKSSFLDIKKIIIISDENMATIPFEALISKEEKPKKNSANDHHTYLINEFELSYQFSSTLWVSSRQKDRIDLKSLNYAGFAPGNFSFMKKSDSIGNDEVSLSSLPFSKNEIHDISDLIIKNGGNTHLFSEHEATEKNFRDHLENYSIIHIATHSIINDQLPELSGLIFFPDKNEEKNRSINDGILFLDEIFNLMINADLLVLSACATGTGKITRSEGVLAVTRGFFTAGASNIVYTLWNVTDKHTKDFMVSFFKGILAGQTYSGALRNAKLEMLRNPGTSLPRLWAPYVLLGR